MNLRITLAIAALNPAIALAQVPASTVPGALVKKTLPIANVRGTTGTRIQSVNSYGGTQCADGCIVATGIGGPSGVSVRFADAAVKVEEVRTALIIPHEKSHSLRLTLDRAEILGVQYDARGALKASPTFQPLGATNKGYKWAIFKGSTMLKSGHSNGESVEWNGDGHSAGQMQLAVFSDATLEISHGGSRLVMTSDDSDAIQGRTGGSLRFNDLGVQVGGVPKFAVVSAQIQGVNR